MTDGFDSFDQSADNGTLGLAASSPSLTESAPYATAQNTQCNTLARSQLKEKSLPTEAPLYLSAMDGEPELDSAMVTTTARIERS